MKTVDIEAALRWAYRDELPKRGAAASLETWESAILLGTRIDRSHREAGFPIALGEPHPDAFRIDLGVQALRAAEIDLGESLSALCPAWHAAFYDPNDWQLRPVVIDPRPLLIARAIMGSPPDWQVDEPYFARRIGANGKPMVEGIRPDGSYEAGAICPVDMRPEPRHVLAARAEYVVWHRALISLADSLRLETLCVTRPSASPAPWAIAEVGPIVHKDLSAPKGLASVKRPRRKRAA